MTLLTSLAMQGASTGLASPSSIYAAMRQIESQSAAPLNLDIEEHVASEAYKAAWRAWYQSWLAFLHAYATPEASTWNKLGAYVYPEEIQERAESLRRQLEDFYRTYPSELSVNGRRVPAPRGQAPLLHVPPKSGWPLWTWALGLGAIGTAGYLTYRHVTKPAPSRKRTR